MKRPLFDSCFLGSLLLRNRFIRSATHEGLAEENGLYSPELTSLYADLARDGIGMIITGHTWVSPEGEASPRQASAASEEAVELWRIATGLVHRNGGTIALQLAHGGGSPAAWKAPSGRRRFPIRRKRGSAGRRPCRNWTLLSRLSLRRRIVRGGEGLTPCRSMRRTGI